MFLCFFICKLMFLTSMFKRTPLAGRIGNVEGKGKEDEEKRNEGKREMT